MPASRDRKGLTACHEDPEKAELPLQLKFTTATGSAALLSKPGFPKCGPQTGSITITITREIIRSANSQAFTQTDPTSHHPLVATE